MLSTLSLVVGERLTGACWSRLGPTHNEGPGCHLIEWCFNVMKPLTVDLLAFFPVPFRG